MTRRALLLSALLLAGGAGAREARAQVQVRLRSITTGRLVQLRPLVFDTVSGTFVTTSPRTAAPLTEDLEANAWGLGIPGLRATALVRLRGSVGSDLVWPRYDDHFDALYAFLEFDRPRYRLRAGRLQHPSSLGFYAFDGASAVWRPVPWIRAEAYGGRGLTRGIVDAPTTSAIASVDPFVPNGAQIIAGGSLWAAPRPGVSVAATYQREITSDRDALVSDRGALDAQVPIGSRLHLSASTDVDFAAGAWGRARLAAGYRLPRGGRVDASVFRYRPVFPLNTIWGAFAPQAYHGASVSAQLTPFTSLSTLTVSGAYLFRRYTTTTETTPFLTGLKDVTHNVTLGARLVSGDYVFSGRYRLTTGYGGSQSSGEGELAWDRGGSWHAGLHMTAFQEDEQFRVADGTVFGFGASGRAELGPRMNLRGDLTRYWHSGTSGQAGPNWSQLRGLVTFEITFGASADRVRGY